MRRTKKKANNQYFTKLHEDAILEYAKSIDKRRKTHLYISLIQPAFSEMVDKIVYTYKFNSLANIDELKKECKNWLTTILDKYDASRGSKAFSYFSVITKNWFIYKVKKASKRREYCFDEVQGTKDEEKLVYECDYSLDREKTEFFERLSSEINGWAAEEMRPNEVKVYRAIQTLFDECDNIEIFNKKAIYLFAREITGLNTKQIVSGLKKFRVKYDLFREKWEDGQI